MGGLLTSPEQALWIRADELDDRNRSTDQKVGGSNPSERAANGGKGQARTISSPDCSSPSGSRETILRTVLIGRHGPMVEVTAHVHGRASSTSWPQSFELDEIGVVVAGDVNAVDQSQAAAILRPDCPRDVQSGKGEVHSALTREGAAALLAGERHPWPTDPNP